MNFHTFEALIEAELISRRWANRIVMWKTGEVPSWECIQQRSSTAHNSASHKIVRNNKERDNAKAYSISHLALQYEAAVNASHLRRQRPSFILSLAPRVRKYSTLSCINAALIGRSERGDFNRHWRCLHRHYNKWCECFNIAAVLSQFISFINDAQWREAIANNLLDLHCIVIKMRSRVSGKYFSQRHHLLLYIIGSSSCKAWNHCRSIINATGY